jgi:hypothetical protein
MWASAVPREPLTTFLAVGAVEPDRLSRYSPGGSMDFSAGHLFASLLVSTVGLGFFLYGKKQRRMPILLAGLVLMAFPYLVGSLGWMLAIGAAVVLALWLVVRAGG